MRYTRMRFRLAVPAILLIVAMVGCGSNRRHAAIGATTTGSSPTGTVPTIVPTAKATRAPNQVEAVKAALADSNRQWLASMQCACDNGLEAVRSGQALQRALSQENDLRAAREYWNLSSSSMSVQRIKWEGRAESQVAVTKTESYQLDAGSTPKEQCGGPYEVAFDAQRLAGSWKVSSVRITGSNQICRSIAPPAAPTPIPLTPTPGATTIPTPQFVVLSGSGGGSCVIKDTGTGVQARVSDADYWTSIGFVTVHVREANYGNQGPYYSSDNDFELQSSNGTTYQSSSASNPFPVASSYNDASLPSGGITGGWIDFDVRPQRDTYTILWNEGDMGSWQRFASFAIRGGGSLSGGTLICS